MLRWNKTAKFFNSRGKPPAYRVLAVLFISCFLSLANAESWNLNGHAKYRFSYTHYADDAWFTQQHAQDAYDNFADLRLMAGNRWGAWDANVHYQLAGIAGDTLQVVQAMPPAATLFMPGVIDDANRLFDLTSVIHESEGQVVLQRLDRLNVGYTGQSLVLRVGRQAISWGGGLFYNPMDVFNPFAPDAVDKDYKTGDDLAYGQWLFASSDDVQAVLVPRRNPQTGEVETAYGSAAGKYHGFVAGKEYEVLAARHYDEPMFAVGGAIDWQGAVVRADVIATGSQMNTVMSAVTNISYSWNWFEKNVSGFLEYFYSGFGQNANDYSADSLVKNQPLLEKIQRGELYTLGKHYIGASLSVETTPLSMLTGNLFINTADPSALVQLIYNLEWRQDLTAFGGFSVPVGENGSEFGGIPTETDGVYFSSGAALFAQLAYFF